MSTQSFTKEVHYALSSIHDFFDSYPMRPAIKQIENILFVSASKKVWNKGNPSNLLYFMDKLNEITSAAFVLSTFYSRPGSLISTDVTKDTVLHKLSYFLNSQPSNTAWGCMPRSLTFLEYRKPYLFFKRFAKYKSEVRWKYVYKSITEYALSTESIDSEFSVIEILRIREHLLQLCEACHLLEVRVNLAQK